MEVEGILFLLGFFFRFVLPWGGGGWVENNKSRFFMHPLGGCIIPVYVYSGKYDVHLKNVFSYTQQK